MSGCVVEDAVSSAGEKASTTIRICQRDTPSVVALDSKGVTLIGLQIELIPLDSALSNRFGERRSL